MREAGLSPARTRRRARWRDDPGAPRSARSQLARRARSQPPLSSRSDQAASDQAQSPLEAALLERDEQIAAHQRTAADFANFRRRTAEEREREAGLASEALLLKTLAVA